MGVSWSSVWARIVSAEWMADTGLPLAATLVGLVVAVLIFRRQLSSDRQHLEQTLQHDREQQAQTFAHEAVALRAEHRRESAKRLASRLQEALKWAQEPNPSLIRDFDERFQARLALTTARSELSDAPGSDSYFDEIAEILQAGVDAWAICEEVRARGDGPKQLIRSLDKMFHMRVANFVTTPYLTGLFVEAENLYGWDGAASLPSPVYNCAELDAYRDDRQSWAKQVEAQYLFVCRRASASGPGASTVS